MTQGRNESRQSRIEELEEVLIEYIGLYGATDAARRVFGIGDQGSSSVEPDSANNISPPARQAGAGGG